MSTKKGLGSIAPPPRTPAPVPAIETTAAGTDVRLNVWLPEDVAQELRVLSARTRVSQRRLVEQALQLLFESVGRS